MTIHQGLHKGLNKNKNYKRWNETRGAGTVLLVVLTLALAICAWISLVLPIKQNCSFFKHWQGIPSSFPWEPTFLDAKLSKNLSAVHRLRNYTVDLKLNHLLFSIAGSSQLWPRRKEYVKLWWRPRGTRGFVWLEERVDEESGEELPIVRVSQDINNFSYTNPTGHPSGIRIARIIQEAFRLNMPDVRWFVLGDDDTIFSPDNLVYLLKKYDHRQLYYIGNPSESHSSNTYFSHGMAFGGGGIAISYPLAEALSNMLDDCLERYPFLFGSDDRLHACITELGVPLTREPGFHQFDVHGNSLGLLAAHPITPFISMHHLDEVEPVFPDLSFMDGMRRLTKAMQIAPSSFLQRCICYDRRRKLTFSVASGYVVQIYPYVLLPRELERPEITFKAWNKKTGGGEFDLDTRMVAKSICRKPLLFFLEALQLEGDSVVGLYKRDTSSDRKKRWSFCFSYMYQPEELQWIRVLNKPFEEQWFKVIATFCFEMLIVNDYSKYLNIGTVKKVLYFLMMQLQLLDKVKVLGYLPFEGA
ncbi:hypothetical protein L7F22_059310 [Adiantum nelumboides]|nr:hypothetical protein [Adiantum nelumboides]